MQRREAIQRLIVIGATAGLVSGEVKPSYAGGEDSDSPFINFSPLESLPDDPLAAAHVLANSREPILYPEVPSGHPFRKLIAAQVRVRLADIAKRYGIDKTGLLRVSGCEATDYPNSVNYNFRGPDKPTGLWQFLNQTFRFYSGFACDADFRKDLDVSTLVYIYASGISPKEWACR